MAFYRPLFTAAGFSPAWTDDKTYGGFRNGSVTLFIGESQPRRVTRQAPTGQEFVVTDHIGLSVARREDIDVLATTMKEAGFAPLFPAQEYPEFGPGFYAITFCDRDNNVLEFCHRAVPAGSVAPKEG